MLNCVKSEQVAVEQVKKCFRWMNNDQRDKDASVSEEDKGVEQEALDVLVQEGVRILCQYREAEEREEVAKFQQNMCCIRLWKISQEYKNSGGKMEEFISVMKGMVCIVVRPKDVEKDPNVQDIQRRKFIRKKQEFSILPVARW